MTGAAIGQATARSNVLQFPREASREQRLSEGAVEIESQCQLAGKPTTEAQRLLCVVLTGAWSSAMSAEDIGRLIRAESLLRVHALPALVTAHRAAHELAGIATECEACAERESGGKRRVPAHGRAA